MSLVPLFTDNLLPVFLAASAGYAAAAALRLEARPLSSVAFHVFAPCLIFQVVIESQVPVAALLRMIGFASVSLMALAAVALAIARSLGWSRSLSSAVALCVLLPNAGNFGLSASLLAFGEHGLAQAGLYFIASSILTYTVGVLVASLGRAPLRAALTGLIRVPTIWAVAVAFAMLRLGWSLPTPAGRAVELLAEACIPVFLVILGMQLRGVRVRGPARPLVVAAGLRLLGGAAAALALVPLFGLEGPARQAGVLQSAMPTAVITTILATEYDVDPALVTSVVLVTTLLSPLTLTPLLAILK